MTIAISGDGTITPLSGVRPTGEFAYFMLPAAPAGWILGNGQTIGNPVSGATRANTDTFNLFTAWWAFTDVQLPIYNALGNLSTRGASAQADWDAGKRLTVFDVRGLFPRSADGAFNTTGTKQTGTSVWADSLGDTTVRQASNSSAVINGDAVQSLTGSQTYTTGTYVASAAAQRYVKVRPDNIAMLGCFKL